MKIFLFISIFTFSLQLSFSQETIRVYLDDDLNQVKQDNASICRTVIISKDQFYLADAYIKDGKKIMSGAYSSLKPITEEGDFVYYDDLGEPYASGKYHNGQMTGYWKYYNVSRYDSADYTCLADTVGEISSHDLFFVFTEQQALFQSGDINTFRNYVQEHLVYPDYVLKNIGNVRVTVQFAVCTDGIVHNVKILRSSGSTMLDCECIRALKSSPQWKPSIQGNRDVNQQFVIPIVFSVRN